MNQQTKATRAAYTRAFHAGMIAALAVVHLYDERTLFDEIMGTVDEAELVAVARQTGSMRWSGLTRYGYGKKYPARKSR